MSSLYPNWDEFTVSTHDERILVSALRDAGHKVSGIRRGWNVCEGQNSWGTMHCVFMGDDGDSYGVKCVQSTHNGAQREHTMWGIAHLLGMPGAYKSALISDPRSLNYMKIPDYYAEIFQGPAVVTKWVRDSVTLESLMYEQFRKSVARSTQVGMWWGFCILTEMGDRHNGNFVYSKSRKIFSAIDMENAFSNVDQTRRLRSISSQVNADPKGLRLGAELCAERVEQNLGKIKSLLIDAKITMASNLPDVSTPDRILSSVGG